MFDGGVPEQIHRLIASPPPPPPFPPHQAGAERSPPFPVPFTSFNTNNHMLNMDSRKIIHHHYYHHHHDIKDGGATSEWLGQTDHHDGNNHHPWCTDEVLALLRFRSTMENWFPEFTWEHTSRKLAEVGFKRSPQECKEKFEEEERRYFNSNNNTSGLSNYNNKANYRIFSEVEEIYHHGHDDVSSGVGDNQNKRDNALGANETVEEKGQDSLEENKRDRDQVEEASTMKDTIKSVDNVVKVGNVEDDTKSSSSSSLMTMKKDKKKKKTKKRKKEKEMFGVLKGFCEGLVRNMITQQEEMHKRLLEDMAKKEEEKMAREEAWKKQEMERLYKEIEKRAHEQAMASDRDTNIIKIISKFTHLGHYDDDDVNEVSSSLALPLTRGSKRTSSSSKTLTPLNPLTSEKVLEPISTQTLKPKTRIPRPPKSEENNDLGKRWPRDEVLALINIRCSISSMNDEDHKEGMISSPSTSSKAVPLWERISKKMLEVGYKRSAKRCKEKWENINKYFRKTKDVNKKRPLDSRTCPYFHQLTALYSQPSSGATATTRPEETRVGSGDPENHAAMHVDADGVGERTNVEYSGFDLEF